MNVSGNRTTRIPDGFFVPPRRENHSRSDSGAIDGASRRCVIPPAVFTSRDTIGARSTKFASPGTFDATRTALSISPSAYAARGRTRPE